ncbi:unnamed protein product [Effrenium voratum]|nr:unnamed protein product [Effrenium voratum]
MRSSASGSIAGETDLRGKLAARLRVCILGGTAFLNTESSEFLKVFASELHERFAGEGILFITCGQPGIQEVFAKHCGDGSLIRNLLVAGESAHFRVGQDLLAGRDAEQVKNLFLEVGDVYITVEGGPGVAQDARKVLARGATVLPLKRTGGASAGKFDFPEKALAPSFVPEEQWARLGRSTTPLQEAAKTAVEVMVTIFEDQSRTTAQRVTMEISSIDSDMLSWPSTFTPAQRARRSCFLTSACSSKPCSRFGHNLNELPAGEL